MSEKYFMITEKKKLMLPDNNDLEIVKEHKILLKKYCQIPKNKLNGKVIILK